MGPLGRRQVPLLAAIVMMAMFNLTLVSPVLPEFIKDRFERTDVAIGVFMSAEMLAYIVLAPVWGVLSDRWGRRVPLVLLGLGVSAALFLLMPSVGSFWPLVGVRFVQGAFTVAAWSLAMTMALDWAGSEDRGRTMGVLGTGMMLGMAMGAPLGGVVADQWAISSPFYVASAVFTVALLVAWALLREPLAPERERRRVRFNWKEEGRLWIPGAYGFVDRFTAGFFITLFPVFLRETFDVLPGLRGIYLGIFFLPFALLQYPFGRLTDRYGPLPFVLGGSLAYGLIMMVIARLQLSPIALAMVSLGVLAAAMLPATLVLVGRLSRPETHGVAMGVFNALGSVGFAAGLLLSGVLAEASGYANAFLVGGTSEVLVVAATAIPLLNLSRKGGKGR